MDKHEKRLHRQFAALERHTRLRPGTLRRLQDRRYRCVRIPAALALIVGSLFSFLPVLGVWMLPAGLLLLAVDIPQLRAPVAAATIRARRRVGLWRRWLRRRRRG